MTHLDARRDRYAAILDPGDAVILIGAGSPVGMPGGFDRVYPFMAHPNYYVLAEQECPGAVLAYDAATGWAHFAPVPTEAQRIWDGDVSFDGEPIDGLADWLRARAGRPVASIGSPVEFASDDDASTRIAHRMNTARRVKDEAELARIRAAVRATEAGFALAPDLCRSGATARDIQIDLEAAMFHAGADRTAYDTTVGVGPDAAVFHASPGARVADERHCILIDCGAERDRYCADVTRTYPCDGAFTHAQRDLYNVVLDAQLAAIGACRAGTEWHDVHRVASEAMAKSLDEMGVVSGDPRELVDRGVMGLFFPHGVGHMLGLGVRDAGGVLADRIPRLGPGGVGVRVDLPLEVNQVLTVEPGLYFVDALLDPPNTRAKFDDCVQWRVVDQLRDEIRGIRIEDDVRITSDAPEILTANIDKLLS